MILHEASVHAKVQQTTHNLAQLRVVARAARETKHTYKWLFDLEQTTA